jgi:hypothetical protein
MKFPAAALLAILLPTLANDADPKPIASSGTLCASTPGAPEPISPST